MSGDLQYARTLTSAIRDILERQAVERTDRGALVRIHDLCRDAAQAIDDEYCRTRLHLVSAYAAELLGSEDHSKWDCGTLSGTEFLRRRIREALGLYCSRVERVAWQPEFSERASRGRAHEERIAL